jgi:molybdenum cofactor synthesis domain-containing protein
MDPSAALVVVGNEVLSAKVKDENGPWAARRLRDLGVRLLAIHVVADRSEEIASAVNAERGRAEWVFTSGGVGPTHDDVTVAAVAAALGRPLVRLGPLEAAIREIHRRHHGGRSLPRWRCAWPTSPKARGSSATLPIRPWRWRTW